MKLDLAIQKLRDTIRLRHLSLATEQTYEHWVRRFAGFLSKQPSNGTPAEKMEQFLTMLAKQDVAASTQNQAFCALLFFYRDTLGVEVGKVDALRAKNTHHAPHRLPQRYLCPDPSPAE